MSCMATLWEKLEALCKSQGTSPYKVALNVGLDGSLPNKVFNNKVPSTFDRKIEMLRLMAASTLLRADSAVLEGWLVEEYVSPEGIAAAFMELEPEAKAALLKETAQTQISKTPPDILKKMKEKLENME